jgi:hypothetical protein
LQLANHKTVLVKTLPIAMKKLMPLIDKTGEVRELRAEDLKMFKSAQEVLPLSLQKKLGLISPQKVPK